MPAQMPSISKEYLRVPVTASVDLVAQTVQIAVTLRPAGQATPSIPVEWQAAEWIGAAGPTRNARSLVGPLAAGTYDVWIKVTDSPEIPVRVAGQLIVT